MGKLILVRRGHTPLNAAGVERRLRETVETARRVAHDPPIEFKWNCESNGERSHDLSVS